MVALSLTAISYALSAIYLLGDAWREELAWPVVIVILLRCVADRRTSSLAISLSVSLIYLFIVPCIAYLLEGDHSYVVLLAVSFLLFDLVMALSRETPASTLPATAAQAGTYDFRICILLILATVLFPFVIQGGEIVNLFRFTIPFSVALVYFDRLCRQVRTIELFFLLFLFLCSISSYILFHWSGYGRIVIGSYIMMPVLIAAHHRRFVIRIWHTAVAAPPALSLAIISRGGEGLGNVGTGGAAHHLQLTTEVLASSHHLSSRWGEYFEQWLLFFLNWMPREWWPEKPLGVGSTFVDDWIGRAGFAANHSVSVGYIGESVYFLGPMSPVGILIALLTLVVVRRMIQKFVIPAFSAVIAYDVMLISYVWGGYATFGSRAWFFIVPMAAWALLQKHAGKRHAAAASPLSPFPPRPGSHRPLRRTGTGH